MREAACLCHEAFGAMAVLQLEDVPCCAALGRLRANGTSMARNLVLVAILWSYNPERPQDPTNP